MDHFQFVKNKLFTFKPNVLDLSHSSKKEDEGK